MCSVNLQLTLVLTERASSSVI